MPLWVSYILAAGALIVAVSTIWTKVVKPTLHFFATAEEMLPLLRTLTKEFKGSPEAFRTLNEIASQFHTDHGTTLRDVINELQVSSTDLRQRAEASKILDEQLAAQIARLTVKVDENTATTEAAAATSKRIEVANSGVAHDLAARSKRADEVEGGDAGAAADAAALPPPKG